MYNVKNEHALGFTADVELRTWAEGAIVTFTSISRS